MKSALAIAPAYVIGGFIPLSAYLLMPDDNRALKLSMAIMLISFVIFGCVKGRFTGVSVILSGLRITIVGGLAVRPFLESPADIISFRAKTHRPNNYEALS